MLPKPIDPKTVKPGQKYKVTKGLFTGSDVKVVFVDLELNDEACIVTDIYDPTGNYESWTIKFKYLEHYNRIKNLPNLNLENL